MRLRIATTVSLVFGLLLLVGWPWLIGPQPVEGAPQQEQAAYVVRFGVFIIVVVVTFAVTALLALLAVRSARLAYREQVHENLKDLIEGTLKDHGRKDT